jgi:hypothetical protein
MASYLALRARYGTSISMLYFVDGWGQVGSTITFTWGLAPSPSTCELHAAHSYKSAGAPFFCESARQRLSLGTLPWTTVECTAR